MQFPVMYETSAYVSGVFVCHINYAHYEIVATV